jgi:hypothetical protein
MLRSKRRLKVRVRRAQDGEEAREKSDYEECSR